MMINTTIPHKHHFHTKSKFTLRRLIISLAITLLFVILEAIAGWLAKSLALLSDAGHNLTDALALVLSTFAISLSLRPSDAKRTFGYHRAGILTALFNSTTLVLIAIGIFYEAIKRLQAPRTIESQILIYVGVAALIVNSVTAWIIHKGSEEDLTLRSAFVHLLGDVLASIGAVVAGVVIYFTGWTYIDPVISIFIGGLILWNAWGIIRDTVDILLESTPKDINLEALIKDLTSLKGVRGIHDLHVWSISQSKRNFSAHVLVDEISFKESSDIRTAINELLTKHYGITHVTLQFENKNCEPGELFCNS